MKKWKAFNFDKFNWVKGNTTKMDYFNITTIRREHFSHFSSTKSSPIHKFLSLFNLKGSLYLLPLQSFPLWAEGVKYNKMSTLQLGVTLSSSSPMLLPTNSHIPKYGFPSLSLFPTSNTNFLKNPFPLAHRTYSHGEPRMGLFQIICSATSQILNKVM